jgi:hypothetical protein
LPFFVTFVIGSLISGGGAVACLFAWFICNFHMMAGSRPPLNWQTPLIATASVLIVMAAIGFCAHRLGSLGMLLGIVTGLGVAAIFTCVSLLSQ